MNRRCKYPVGFAACLGLFLWGCGPKVQTVENVKRAAARWSPSETATGATHLCIEFSTAAHELHDRSASANVTVAEGQSLELSYKDAESLATIYSVGEIMQFGHAALYRLCEASGNQAIDGDTYQALFTSTIDKVHGLIELQLLRDKLKSVEYLSVLRSQLSMLDARRCELSRSTSPAAARDLLAKNGEREDLMKEITDLATTLGVRDQVPPPSAQTPSATDWEALGKHEASIARHQRMVQSFVVQEDRTLLNAAPESVRQKTSLRAESLGTNPVEPAKGFSPTVVSAPEATTAAQAWHFYCNEYSKALAAQGDSCNLDAVARNLPEVCPWR